MRHMLRLTCTVNTPKEASFRLLVMVTMIFQDTSVGFGIQRVAQTLSLIALNHDHHKSYLTYQTDQEGLTPEHRTWGLSPPLLFGTSSTIYERFNLPTSKSNLNSRYRTLVEAVLHFMYVFEGEESHSTLFYFHFHIHVM